MSEQQQPGGPRDLEQMLAAWQKWERARKPSDLMAWLTIACVASLVAALMFCEMPWPTVENPDPRWGKGSVLAVVFAAVWMGAFLVDQVKRGS